MPYLADYVIYGLGSASTLNFKYEHALEEKTNKNMALLIHL